MKYTEGTKFVNLEYVIKLEQINKELLEACKEMAEEICTLCIRLNPHHEGCVSCNQMDIWKQAISKAEGE